MKATKIIAVTSLILILVGFCSPWLEFYGLISGASAVRLGISFLIDGHGFSILQLIVLFAFIPIFSILSVWNVLAGYGNRALGVYFVIIDLTLIFTTYIVTGVHSTSKPVIYPGFYIMFAAYYCCTLLR
jgi:hypothetical protein